ncbi:MAG: hypothetical protein JETT_2974 [Candidatus Jettenia ecosi]|uniref:Uncharacterized protein n=1 Tax=Candidatus Jettenia ecosi TaxID=2494326 RepID=A0A533Q813_9BACT|nr:MAG: hypothetical protein JETT_2974 [Candidatus Jettenia ecosi]
MIRGRKVKGLYKLKTEKMALLPKMSYKITNKKIALLQKYC